MCRSDGMAGRTTLQKLTIICLASSIVPSIAALDVALPAAQTLDVLHQRGSTCANATSNSCSPVDSKLPNTFCCSPDDTCISLNSSSTALCCPRGSDCTVIKPILCDVAQQNGTEHPDAAIKTTLLGDNLPTCGSSCCPFGYTCDSQQVVCRIDMATAIFGGVVRNPTSSTSQLSSTSSPTTKSSSTPTSTASASSANGIDSTKTPASMQCSRFPAAAVAAGFFPGVLAGALLALLLVICVGRRHPDRSSKGSSKFSKFRERGADGAIIGVSEPIAIEQNNARTDFLRWQPDALKRTGTRVKSWFSSKGSPRRMDNERSPYDHDNWKMPTPPVPDNVPLEPLGTRVPITPERPANKAAHNHRAVTKEQSMESIKVYSPPSMLRPLSKAYMQGTGVPPIVATRTPKMSPLKTPEKDNLRHNAADNGDADDGTMLTPARYEGDAKWRKHKEDPSRPNTTFTDMLHGIGFPDPGPPMPAMPKALNTKKGKI